MLTIILSVKSSMQYICVISYEYIALQKERQKVMAESKKWINFQKALANLKEIENKLPPYDTVVETGMVALYEICFEQAWKAMKDRLEFAGYAENKIGSPKGIIKLAYQAGMIDDEQLWLEALQARNNVAHSYNEQIALGIISDSKEKFIEMFEALQNEIQENWM